MPRLRLLSAAFVLLPFPGQAFLDLGSGLAVVARGGSALLPCFYRLIPDLHGAVLSDKYVVTDGNVITARGAGVALEFGFAIIAALRDKTTAGKIKGAIQCP